MDTERIARLMFAAAMRMMPSAACSTESPIGVGNSLGYRVSRRSGIDRHATAQQCRRIEPLQHDVGIRQRRLVPPLP